MDKKIIEKLRQDEHYYGDYGKQFLSNSDISVLLKNPKMLREPKPKTSAMGVGGYFHTAILEPNKLKSFKIIESSTRNTKKYKEMSDGENSIKATAVVGVDLNQKGMQTAQQFGAASSYGKKYALGNLFLIDDTADADSTNSGGIASKIVNKAKTKMTDDQYKKAVEFVKGGGSITAIESKYTITPEQMVTFKELNNNG